MTRLTLLLIFKIAFTAMTVVAPFLLLPADRLADFTGGGEPVPSLYRLYGVAILALLVGYSSAIPTAQRGELPRGILTMGLVSNAGATATLLSFGVEGFSAVMAATFGTIAVLLLLSLVSPAVMLRTLFGKESSMSGKVA